MNLPIALNLSTARLLCVYTYEKVKIPGWYRTNAGSQ